MTTAHDVRDRRSTASNMERALDALAGCVADLTLFPGDKGVSYLVADRLSRLTAEIAAFKARDLLNLRKIEGQS